MKFQCSCGHVIRDQTDFIPYKGYLVPDQRFEEVWNCVESALDAAPPAGHMERDRFFGTLGDERIFIGAYQCTDCGRLYISDGENGFHIFAPEGHKTTNLFEKRKPG